MHAIIGKEELCPILGIYFSSCRIKVKGYEKHGETDSKEQEWMRDDNSGL